MAILVRRARSVFSIALALVWLLASPSSVASSDDVVRFGLFSDLHAHDLDSPAEQKWMSQTEERLQMFVDAMNDWAPDFVAELGDFVNGWLVLGVEQLGSPDRIPDLLLWARDLVRQFDGPVHHVIGNHDVYNLDKSQYMEILGLESTSYSFDVGAYHFIVLDLQYKEDGSDLAHTYTGVAGFVPEPLLAWLRQDLASTDRPTLLLVHQPLDDYSELWGRPTVLNRDAVQQVLIEGGNVIAVFQGHTHRSVHEFIDGIHYVTFAALVDQNTPPAWAYVTLDPLQQRILIEGVGTQETYDLMYTTP
jgi:3',5'-cyclic AMP phosphodiesterase CpdA